MTENEKLTEKRDGQNVIPLRQDGKTIWSLASAGMGNASTQFLYGTHADRLAEYEAIGTVEEFKAIKKWKADLIDEFCRYDANSCDDIVANVRNKAINEFAEEAMKQFTEFDLKHGYPTVADCKIILEDIAEQMKGGE